MEFDDEVYVRIVNELLEKKLVLDDGYEIVSELSLSNVMVNPSSSYCHFRRSYPELNDYYDMKYDLHVVYYAIMYYHNVEWKKFYEERGEEFKIDVAMNVEELVDYLHDMERKYSVRKIENMKKICKK